MKGRRNASRDSLTHLGKASQNTGLFIIKSAKKIEWLKFRPQLAMRRDGGDSKEIVSETSGKKSSRKGEVGQDDFSKTGSE